MLRLEMSPAVGHCRGDRSIFGGGLIGEGEIMGSRIPHILPLFGTMLRPPGSLVTADGLLAVPFGATGYCLWMATGNFA